MKKKVEEFKSRNNKIAARISLNEIHIIIELFRINILMIILLLLILKLLNFIFTCYYSYFYI